MNRDQKTGIVERWLYTILAWLGVRAASRGWIDPAMVEYIADASGVIILAGQAVYAWWVNRPTALLNSATDSLPKNSQLVITTSDVATGQEKREAVAMAKAANDKVTASTVA